MLKRFKAGIAAGVLSAAMIFGQAMPVMAASDQTYNYTVNLTGGPITLKAYEMTTKTLRYHGFLHNEALGKDAEKDAAAFVQAYFFNSGNSRVVSAYTGKWYEGQNVLYAVIPNGTDKVVYLQVNKTAHQDGTGVSADFVDITLLSGDQNGTAAVATTTKMMDTAAGSYYNVNRVFALALGNGQN